MTNRQCASRHDQAAIQAARECRDGAFNFVGIATSTGLNSTPNDGATIWTAPNCPGRWRGAHRP
jgi:hypothetical protein